MTTIVSEAISRIISTDFGTENPYREFNKLVNNLVLPEELINNCYQRFGDEYGYYGIIIVIIMFIIITILLSHLISSYLFFLFLFYFL